MFTERRIQAHGYHIDLMTNTALCRSRDRCEPRKVQHNSYTSKQALTMARSCMGTGHISECAGNRGCLLFLSGWCERWPPGPQCLYGLMLRYWVPIISVPALASCIPAATAAAGGLCQPRQAPVPVQHYFHTSFACVTDPVLMFPPMYMRG